MGKKPFKIAQNQAKSFTPKIKKSNPSGCFKINIKVFYSLTLST